MTLSARTLAVVWLLFLPALAFAQDAEVRPFLTKHCLECHGEEKPKGDFRVDRLTADFADEANRKAWQAAREKVESGVMPPKTKPRPAAEDSKKLVQWVSKNANSAEAARRAIHGRVPLRRLNRIEYENTVRDLLGIDLDLRELLPLDSTGDGFDTTGESQHISSYLLERYLEAADAALNVAIVNNAQPPSIKKRLLCKDERHVKVTTEKVFRTLDDGLAFFSSSAWQAVTMSSFYPPDRGKYRIRISASAFQSGGKPVAFRVDAGPMLMATKNHLVGYFDAPADEPRVVEFVDHLEARSTIRILPYGLASAQAVNKIGADVYDGPGLAVQWVEVEGPLHDSWPPASHRQIFGDLSQGPAPSFNNSKRVEVVSKNPEEDAERILADFASRAFRRPATADEVTPFVELVKARLAAKNTFEQSIRVGLKAVLVSPKFLYLSNQSPARLAGPTLDDFALASRLSYFLWSTMPDEELLTLAKQSKLSQPDVLHSQVERLLKSPKAAAFTENFVGQWLGLRDIDFTEPSYILYPEYDHLLRVSMVRETELFFNEVLKDDLSLTNFVASDFSMLNGRLAKHYGIPNVEGHEFRKLPLPKDSHRGGVLTMASVLKVTANGTTTSPVIRGAWVNDRLLGKPPPKPPADVPSIEPDTRGATTIREQLAKHRQLESCASCHAAIDPPGFALESFDVIGGYRENYRTTGNGGAVVVDGRRMPYHKGKPVDPSDVLPDGAKFQNVDELKALLLRDKDSIARCLTEKLVTYGTGAAPGPLDREAIAAIVAKARTKDYGFRTLVHEIVQSQLFRSK